METYIALLRGINVGGNNKVEMKKLKASVESLGFVDVSTYINSGNVIFSTKRTDIHTLEKKLTKVIEKDFSLAIPVVVRSIGSIRKVAAAVPTKWQNNKEEKTDVFFLFKGINGKDSLKELNIVTKLDTVKYVDGAIIWHLDRKDYNKSGIHDVIGTNLYKNVTVRNINTVRKLLSLTE